MSDRADAQIACLQADVERLDDAIDAVTRGGGESANLHAMRDRLDAQLAAFRSARRLLTSAA